jgi:hypothetical protein
MQDAQSIGGALLGEKVLQFNYLVVVCMPVVFVVLHVFVLTRFSAVYRRSNEADRMISCQHAVYFLVFSVSLVPQTVLAIRIFFRAWTGFYLASSELAILVGVFAGTRLVLYTTEAAVRSVVKPSWLLLTHHLLCFVGLVLVMWTHDAVVLAAGLVLDLGAVHEAPLYAALLAHRLHWPPKAARHILRSACAWYTITRVVQTVLLLYMLVKFAALSAV